MEGTGSAGAPAWTWAVPLIVGVIALGGVIATAYIANMNIKRQIKSAHILKIAEMRQAWINGLRDAMASFQSYGVTPELDHRTSREFYEKGTKIELMMNPLDPDYQECTTVCMPFCPQKKFLRNTPPIRTS